MMRRTTDLLLTDLRHQIADLGKGGGLIGPSIYDTAQALRFAPPPEGPCDALSWLLEQQQADGGWGDPAAPRARDVPTLAAVLALRVYGSDPRQVEALEAGRAFLRQIAPQWEGPLPDDLPVGIELLLPRMLDDAAALGLDVPREPYAGLLALGNRRRRIIEALTTRAATPPVHSWEAWGQEPWPELVDGIGSVGNSPAATAAWLRAAAGRAGLAPEQAAAERYLRRAAEATGSGIPGVLPTVWPINRLEQVFGLYMLHWADLLGHGGLQGPIDEQLRSLERAMRADGIGMSDNFASDGDDSAAALVVLRWAGRRADLSSLQGFALDDHYCAYQGELQPSLSVTAHALHALSVFGHHAAGPLRYVRQLYRPRAGWASDKWNGSWHYTTGQAVTSLLAAGACELIPHVRETFVARQRADGGWGTRTANLEETAYAVLALLEIHANGFGTIASRRAAERGAELLRQDYRPLSEDATTCWLGKEMFRPRRLARLIEVAAIVAAAVQEELCLAAA